MIAKIVGMFLVVLSAAYFAFEYIKKQRMKLLVFEELFRFIERIRMEIGCYLKPISEISADFSSDVLSRLGFLRDVGQVGVYSAYQRLAEKVKLDDEERRPLDRFFSSVGKGYADDELKLSGATLSELDLILKRKRENAPKENKLSLTLSCAGALALIILLI